MNKKTLAALILLPFVMLLGYLIYNELAEEVQRQSQKNLRESKE